MCVTSKKTKVQSKDRLATEEKLIIAAEKVFSKFGFKGATTRLIAQTAKVNPALINRYFDGKYGLLIAIIEKEAEEYRNNKLQYPPQKTLKEEIVAFAQSLFNACIDKTPFYRIVMGQFLTDQKFLKKFRDAIPTVFENTEFKERLKAFNITKKEAEGVFKQVDLYTHSVILMDYILQGNSKEEVEKTFYESIANYGDTLELRLKKNIA